MKKLMLFVVLVMGLSFISVAQNNNGNNQVIRTAKQAARQCIQDAKEPGFEISAQTKVVSSCFVNGFITEVTFYKSVKSHGNNPTIQSIEVVATVTIGCDGEIMSADCSLNSI